MRCNQQPWKMKDLRTTGGHLYPQSDDFQCVINMLVPAETAFTGFLTRIRLTTFALDGSTCWNVSGVTIQGKDGFVRGRRRQARRGWYILSSGVLLPCWMDVPWSCCCHCFSELPKSDLIFIWAHTLCEEGGNSSVKSSSSPPSIL